jgi:hypothetical protein
MSGVMCTRAPAARQASAAAAGAAAGITTVAATPSAPAASATARAWLPPLTAATPAARCSGVIVSSLWNAPRTLNEPVRCNSSSFTVTGAPSSADSPGLRTVGVRSTCSAIRSPAAVISSRPSSSLTRPS